jgi:hypothetical protein
MRRSSAAVLAAALIAAIVLGFYILYPPPPPELRLIPPPPRAIHGKSSVFTCSGYGWSTKGDPKAAVREAVLTMREAMGENEPEVVLVFMSSIFDENAVVRELRRLLPNTKIYGGTSHLATITPDGFHTSENGSLSILGVYSTRIDFGVGGASLDELSPEEAGRRAIEEATVNAGRAGEMPQMILITGSLGSEEGVIRGIDSFTGGGVPVFGGTAADEEITGEWRQIANDEVYSNGVSVLAIYTDLKFGYLLESGYVVTERSGTVTRAEGRTIYEIDNRPAAEVYNEWTGGAISEKLSGGVVLAESTFYPLAKRVRSPSGAEYILSAHPISVDGSTRSLDVAINMENGADVALMHGTWELLLNRCFTTPKRATEMSGIKAGEGTFAVYVYCAGSMGAIPACERVRVPGLVSFAVGDVPFIGTLTLGEQGMIEGLNQHVNLATSIVIFTDEEGRM